MGLHQFIDELRSRGVYRVAAIYSAGAWALLQVADIIFPILDLPEWSVTAVLVAAAVGFPVAIILSWLFDLTPEGLVEAAPVAAGPARFPRTKTHIIELVLIVFLILLVGYLYAERLGNRATDNASTASLTAPRRASIAVMPFINMSGVKRMEYLGDGLAEEILNLLAKLNELDVAARTSSFYFKNKEVDIRTIGEHLAVSHVLEGSVRQDAGRVRVTAQLIQVSNGYHLWSETYDRELDSALALQDEIAREVVRRLQVLLSPESRNLLSRSVSVDPAAYDYYLQGRAYLRLPSGVGNLESAKELFEKATQSDGRFADAFAGLCDSLLGLYSIDLENVKFHEAEAACQHALVLNRRASSVYVALGNLYRTSGQYEQAVTEFNTAISLNGNSADAFLGLAETYLQSDQDELAEQAYQQAIDLQPNYWKAYMGMGNYLFSSGRIEKATPYYRRITELMPRDGPALNNLGAALFLTGNFEQATQFWEESLKLSPSAITYSNVATSLYFSGRYEEAVALYHKAVEFTPDHYELWGNLGDAYSQMAQGADLAAPMYENAIILAEKRLQINAYDSRTLSLVGHYQARLGERDLALGFINRAMELSPQDMDVNYVLATALATLGEQARALEALEHALEQGYPWHLARADASLKDLKNMPRYEALSARLE